MMAGEPMFPGGQLSYPLVPGQPGHEAAGERALELVCEGRLDLRPLTTHRLPLSRYAEGVDLLRRREAIKVCFLPQEE